MPCPSRRNYHSGTARIRHAEIRIERAFNLKAEIHLRAIVQDKHQRATNAADDVRKETLVQTFCQALLGSYLLEAVHSAFVQVLFDRLLRLHLQSSAHGVKGVRGASADSDSSLRCNESGHGTQNSLVFLVRVEAGNCVEATELETTPC